MTTETTTTVTASDAIRALVDLRDRTLQKSRIAFGNRVSALDRGADEADAAGRAIIEKWFARFEELEAEADADLAELVKEIAIVRQMRAVKGVGPTLSAKIVAMIDIGRADTVSALWRYAGYAVIDGARERPVRGEKLHYNSRLKTALYLLAGSFLKANSPYRQIYDDARAHYGANRPDWTDGHRHAAAMRKMIKIFLSHLWVRWRALEGLPTRAPYAMEYQGHTSYERPEDYGWPDPNAPRPKRGRKAQVMKQPDEDERASISE